MTKFEKTSSFNRRSLLLGGGALVVSVGAAVSLDAMLSINAAYAQGAAIGAKPPLTPDQLSSDIAVNGDGSVHAYDDLPQDRVAFVDRGLPFEPWPDGRPRLDDHDVDDLVAFLKTLTDADVDDPGHAAR